MTVERKETPQDHRGMSVWIEGLILAAACAVGYISTLSAGFLADDIVIVYALKNHSIFEIMTSGLFFRPLVWLTFASDERLFGNWALGFHLVNLVLHFAASLGVAACARIVVRRRTAVRRYAGLVAGLAFAWHPAHPEAVVWIAGRYDLVAGALLAWSLYFHLRARDGNGKKPVLQAVSLVLFALACVSKESAFMFPFVILAAEWLRPEASGSARRTWSSRLASVAPFFAVALILFVLRWILLGGLMGGEYVPEESAGLAAWKIIYNAFVQPFKILVFPLNQPLFRQVGVHWVILCGLILVSPLLLLFFGFRWRIAAFCALAIVLFALPTAYVGIVEDELRNSRFLYVPSIFYSLCIGAILANSLGSRKTVKAAAILAWVWLGTSFICLLQNDYAWHEAGKLVRSAEESTEVLVDRYRDQWGEEKSSILAFNVPRTYMGALAFDWGFPEMLRMRYPDELGEVEIEVIHQGIQTEENFRKADMAVAEGSVIWLFDDRTWRFVEY
jgi:hypothetical protein